MLTDLICLLAMRPKISRFIINYMETNCKYLSPGGSWQCVPEIMASHGRDLIRKGNLSLCVMRPKDHGERWPVLQLPLGSRVTKPRVLKPKKRRALFRCLKATAILQKAVSLVICVPDFKELAARSRWRFRNTSQIFKDQLFPNNILISWAVTDASQGNQGEPRP